LPEENAVEALNPFCNNIIGTSENTALFQFFASSAELTFTIEPQDCDTLQNSSGNFSGMQAIVFPACSFQNSLFCNASCESNIFDIVLTELQAGELYMLALDGCNGSFCSFSITLTQGELLSEEPTGELIINAPEVVCENEDAVISLSQLSSEASIVWTADPPVSFSTVNGGRILQIANWSNNGIYSFCASIQNNPPSGPTTDTCLVLEVLEAPILNFISPSLLLCEGETMSLLVEGEFFDEIFWTNSNNNLSCTACPSPELTMGNEDLAITVSLINTTTSCFLEANIQVELEESPACIDATNEALGSQSVQLFPNPAEEQFRLESDCPIQTIKVFSIQGELLLQRESDFEAVSVAKFPAGVYLLEVLDKNGKREILRWVKK